MHLSRLREIGRAMPGMGHQIKMAMLSHARAPHGECPSCGYSGRFRGFGNPVRSGVQCPSCGSLERHRLFSLAVKRGDLDFAGQDVLHFAPEDGVARSIKATQPKSYTTSSYPENTSDLRLDIQNTGLPGASYDTVIAFHILEHVDDTAAMAEIFRILRPNGRLVAMVPIVEGWNETYENPNVSSEADRESHFGQFDHVRYFGADFRDKLRAAGFIVDEVTANGMDSVTYRLMRGEKIFIGKVPA